MASQAYWRYREQKALERRLQQEEDYYKQLDVIFGTMQDEIERQIYAFYARYAENEGITIAEAKKRADALDIEAYARKAARYVDEKNFSPKANAEMALYNLAMKVSRLELLRANIGLEMVAQFDKYADFMEEILDDRTIDELRRQAGILGETIIDNAKMAHEIVNSSFHGATFSDRIWDDQTRLKNEMKKLLQRGLIQGKNPRDLARQLRKVIDTTKHNAERLMRTELARVQIGAQMQSYIDMDFNQYTFHANSSCCDVCKGLNGKHFFIADVSYGENAPPIHPNCRCSTSPYSSDEEYEEWFEELTGQKSALNMSDEELFGLSYSETMNYSARRARNELSKVEQEEVEQVDKKVSEQLSKLFKGYAPSQLVGGNESRCNVLFSKLANGRYKYSSTISNASQRPGKTNVDIRNPALANSIHERTHDILNQIAMKNAGITDVNNISELQKTIYFKEKKRLAEGIYRYCFSNESIDEIRKICSQNISKRAADSGEEFISEGMVQFLGTKNHSRLSKKVYNYLKKEWRKAY